MEEDQRVWQPFDQVERENGKTATPAGDAVPGINKLVQGSWRCECQVTILPDQKKGF
jgi:hypothetical protein